METKIGLSIDGTTSFNTWNDPIRVEVNEYPDRIEMIYKQTSTITVSTHPASPLEKRMFKIVFSCVDGKWDKSEPIYGKIIAPRKECYEFKKQQTK